MGPPLPRVRGAQDQLSSRVGPRPLLGHGGGSRASGGPVAASGPLVLPGPQRSLQAGPQRSGTRPSTHLPISGPSAGIRPDLAEAGAKAGNGPG